MKTWFLALLAAGTFSTLAAACAREGAPPAGPVTTTGASLDGRTFDVVGEVPAGSNLPHTIDVTFAGGMLDASACRAQGLPPIPYTMGADGAFHAERRMADGLDTWNGRVSGDRLEGTFSTAKGGAIVLQFPFHGKVR